MSGTAVVTEKDLQGSFLAISYQLLIIGAILTYWLENGSYGLLVCKHILADFEKRR